MASSSVRMASSSATKSPNLLIDTDAGVDDAIALFLALGYSLRIGSPHNVSAITCSWGNTSLDNVVENVRKIVSVACPAGKVHRPEIHRGDAFGLNGETSDASYFHGKDGLGDACLDIPSSDLPSISPVSAVDAILYHSSLSTESNPLTIVTLGPLTTISKVLTSSPNFFASHPHVSLVIMGGCGNQKGNASRVAEFNIVSDTQAAEHVFNEWIDRITVVPWDLCVEYPLPWSSYDSLIGGIDNAKLPPSTKRGFLNRICEKVYRKDNPGEVSKRSKEGAVICDALAVAVAIDKADPFSHQDTELVSEKERVNVEVCRGGICDGQTVVDWGVCYDGVERKRDVDWVSKVNVGKFDAMLRESLLG